ncbi:hypothetical protein ALO95_03017 [Pseudomonas syringae pv. antirrhini]|uniref:Uncharacterized protein n=3 Tax=Pseudomonas TaxID=286 RepID=A0A0P9LWD2_9PSED|nr:Uncharacterized protein ALO88_02900 [Pseudomonas syringae pv. antirrhini]RMP36491.1 hypothetical protein ALQ23_01425 [Pseudomonas syringae pv. antirrhini]RMW28785.1 hypothetical protein ALO95_03017 [Pseudomonas syringae pv. antirrhini]
MAWGHTQAVVPDSILDEPTPAEMRFWEKFRQEKQERTNSGAYVPAPFEGVNLHQKYDQECMRFAQLPAYSKFWIYINLGGKWIFLIFTPFYALISLAMHVASKSSYTKVDFLEAFIGGSYFISLPFLLCWIIGHIVINHFPRIWFRPPKGPLWELNRRTGLVTIFGYKRHRKEGVIDEFIAPFYEFDAYMITTHDRHGSYYGLLLQHRYEEQRINFHALLGPDDFQQRPCALWDFLQNYMDTSGPIPDIPLFEPYRHLDPVTAIYDQQRGRNSRYWIDMDDATFKAEVDAMWQRVYAIDTFSRPNLMARYVDYGS